MACTINADDGVISGSAGVKTTADTTGALNIQTNGTTAISISSAQVVSFPATTSIGTLYFAAGTAAAPSISATGDSNTGIYFPGADQIAITTGGTQKLFVGSSMVVNEDGLDFDTRIEGDTDANLLFVDASTDRVGVGLNNPGAKLHVSAADGTAPLTLNTAGGSDATRALNFNVAGDNYGKILVPSGSGGAMAFWTGAANAAAERLRIDASGNLGLGVTPSAWGSIFRSTQLGIGGFIAGRSDVVTQLQLGCNGYYDGSNWKFLGTGRAVRYYQDTGAHYWENSASGSAGGTITFTTAMLLDASGNLGIKTTTPGVNLEIGANDSTTKALSVRYSSVPLYLSGGFDGTYALSTFSTNSYNTSSGSSSWSSFSNPSYCNSAVQLATSTSGSEIRFLTAAAANTNPSERARFDSSGNLLVGFTSHTSGGIQKLIAINADNSCGVTLNRGGNVASYVYTYATTGFRVETTSSYDEVQFSPGGSGGVKLNTGNTSWSALSDERYKTDLRPIENASAKVAAIRAVTGRYKTDPESHSRAFLIAQDVQAVLPEAINTANPDELGLRYTEVIPLLVAAIKELKAEIDVLKGLN